MFYRYYPLYTPPPPPEKKDFEASLTRAVNAGDVKKARKIFDEAFYNKIELVPDWYQLYTAARIEDADMVQLLGAHGATLTKEQAVVLQDIYPVTWPVIAYTLRKGDVRIDYSDLPSPDIATRLAMTQRIAVEDGNVPLLEETGKAVADEILKRLREDDGENAMKLLRLRQPEGPADFDLEAGKIISAPAYDARTKQAIDTLSRLNVRHRIKKIMLNMEGISPNPQALCMMHQCSLLEKPQTQRMRLIDGWLNAGGKNFKAYRDAAEILFKKEHPVWSKEVDAFIFLYKNTTINNGSKIMDRICESLRSSTGFFTAGTWTEDRLRILTGCMEEGAPLSREFNTKIAEGRFRGLEGKELVKNEKALIAFVVAHQKGYYKATADQTLGIIDALRNKYKNGDIPIEAAFALHAMKEGGAHFHKTAFDAIINPKWATGLLGKKEPGLAKILLDLGVLRPEDFSFAFLIQKAKIPAVVRPFGDGKAKVAFNEKKLTGKYAEFFCQVFLERYHPEEFIPQRGEIASYRDKFLEKNPPPNSHDTIGTTKKRSVADKIRSKTGPMWPFL